MNKRIWIVLRHKVSQSDESNFRIQKKDSILIISTVQICFYCFCSNISKNKKKDNKSKFTSEKHKEMDITKIYLKKSVYETSKSIFRIQKKDSALFKTWRPHWY